MKIKVLLIKPNKEPKVVKIPASLKFIEAFIGPNLYKERLEKNVYLFADNNANKEDFNRFLRDGGIILGDFIIVSIKNKHLKSLKRDFISKYKNAFKLRKHQQKIQAYKDKFLEDYYSEQRIKKNVAAILEKQDNLKDVA